MQTNYYKTIIVFLIILSLAFLLSNAKRNTLPNNDCFNENRELYLPLRDSLVRYTLKFYNYEDTLNLEQLAFINVKKHYFSGFFIKDLRDTLNNSLNNKCVELIDNHAYYISSYYLHFGMNLLFYWENGKPVFWYTYNSSRGGGIDSTKEAKKWSYIEEKLGKEEMILIRERYHESRKNINQW